MAEPVRAADEVRHHFRHVGIFDGQVLSRGRGERDFARVLHGGFRLVNAAFPISHHFPGHYEFSVGWHRAYKTHLQLSTKAEPTGLHSTGPKHDFIKHGGNETAMHHALEAVVFRARAELRTHQAAVAFEAQIEAERVGFAADETRSGVRQRLHEF